MRNPSVGVHVEGTVNTQSAQAMAIDPAGMAHIMSVLTNLYGDAPLAVVREYATNARDAHQQAGVQEAIEVSLPTALEPTLRVRDYGAGLSRQDILDVYARYGTSTKRDSDDQVGAFGLGSKSAFTLTQQFVVTSVHGGRRVGVLFAMGADGVGTVTVLHDAPAGPQERSGVEVAIGVPNPGVVRAAAERLFSTWPSGSVLVDGQSPLSVRRNALLASDDLILADERANHLAQRGWHVVMGGVAYPLPQKLMLRDDLTPATARALYSTKGCGSVYMNVPIGAVDITPSREGLRDTPKTLATVRKMLTRLAAMLRQRVQAEIDGAVSELAATWIVARHRKHLDRTLLPRELRYRGALLGQPVTVSLPSRELGERSDPRDRRGRPLLDLAEVSVSVSNIDQIVVVTDTPARAVRSRNSRRYLTTYRPGMDIKTVVFAPDSAGTAGWFAYGPGSPIHQMTYNQFQQVTATEAGSVTRRGLVYQTLSPGESIPEEWEPAWLRELTVPPVVVPTEHFDTPLTHRLLADRVRVRLTRQQTMSGLLRRVPDAVDGTELLRERAQKFIDQQPPALTAMLQARNLLERHRGFPNSLAASLGAAGKAIPALRDLAAAVTEAEQGIATIGADFFILLSAYRLTGQPIPSEPSPPEVAYQRLLQSAPLLDCLLSHRLTDPQRAAAISYLTTITAAPDSAAA